MALCLVVGTGIVIIVHRAKQSQEDYFVGGRRIGGTVSALTYAVTTYSAFMMVGLVGLALIFQSYGGFSFTIGAAFAAVIIALWAIIGGLRVVALTDAIQGVFMLIVALVGVIWAGNRFKGFEVSTFPNIF